MKRLKLEINVAHFVVTLFDKSLRYITDDFLSPYWSYKFEFNKRIRRAIRVKDKPFFINYTDENGNNVYRIHKSLLRSYIGYIGANGKISSDAIELVNNTKEIHGLPDEIKYNDTKYVMRDYQANIIERVLKNKERLSMINVYTGGGKTAISFKLMSMLRLKIGMFLLPKYIEKAAEDIEDHYPEIKGRYLIIQGGDALRDLMLNAETYKKKYSVFIFSIRTITNYLSVYDNRKGDMFLLKEYPISPENLMQALGIGIFLNDESHQEPVNVSKMMLYFDCDYFILLTATFNSNDPHTVKMYKMMIPDHLRFGLDNAMDKYITINNIRYFIEKAPRLKHQTNQGYSQILFEQSLLARPYLLTQYGKMIIKYVERDYINKKKKDQKCLVYASTVDMCKHLCQILRREYPHLKISTYVQEDDYENIMTSDISVSTSLSASTGLDIKGLICIIQTISMGSLQANRQMVGRLRKIPDTELTYDALYCGNLRKHKDLYKQRESCTKDIAKEWHYETYRPNAWETELKLR